MSQNIGNGAVLSDEKEDKIEKGDHKSSTATEFFGKLRPLIERGIDLYTIILPYYYQISDHIFNLWKIIEPYYYQYNLSQYGYLVLGLVLLFFGGHFSMTIACFTAIQLSGLSLIKSSWHQIKINYEKAMETVHKDEKARTYLDRDGDGRISSEEISYVAQRFVKGDANTRLEILGNLRAVFIAVDPQQVMSGLIGIWTAIITVLATLRSTFAKDIALGISIGEMLSKNISQYAKYVLRKNLTSNDDDLKKWIDFGIDTFFKLIGVSIAFILIRVTSAFHASVKGGYIVSYYVFQFLFNQQLLPPSMTTSMTEAFNSAKLPSTASKSSKSSSNAPMMNIESNSLFMFTQYGLALYGFWWQFSTGFALNSWLLRLILLPFTIIECILSWVAAY